MDSSKKEALKDLVKNRFNRILNLFDSVLFVADQETRFLTVFGKDLPEHEILAEKFYGKTPAQALGREQGLIHERYFRQCLEGVPQAYPCAHLFQNSGADSFEMTLVPVEISSGEVAGIFGFLRKNRQGVSGETPVFKEQGFFHLILEHVPFMIMLKEAKTLEILNISSAGAELFGHSSDFLTGKTMKGWMDLEQASVMEEKDRQALAIGEAMEIPEEPLVDGQGRLRLLRSRRLGVSDASGTPRYLLYLGEDVTETRKAELNLWYRTELEKLLTSLAAKFINIHSSQINGEIQDALAMVTQFVSLDRGYLFLYRESEDEKDQTFFWSDENLMIQKPEDSYFMELYQLIQQHRKDFVFFSEFRPAPPSFSAFKAKEKISSLLALPLKYDGYVMGFLAFDTLYESRDFPPEDIAIFKILASILVSALKRKESDEILMKVNEILEARVEERTHELKTLNHSLQEEINERIMAEEVLESVLSEMKSQHQLIRSLLDFQDNAVFLTNGTEILEANRSLLDLMGEQSMKPEDFFAQILEKEKGAGQEIFPEFFSFLRNPFLKKVQLWDSRKGELRFFQVQVTKISKQTDHYIISFSDVTELEEYSRRMEAEAVHDPLTGIFNRRKFQQILEEEYEAYRQHGTPFSMIMVDIDHFKKINDSFGHDQGDQVIRGVVEAIQESIRTTDFFARWGGEEFIILSQHLSGPAAEHLAERLRKAVESRDFSPVEKVTCSFGVAEIRGSETPERLSARADEALYAAKEKGRNRVILSGEA